MQIHELDNYSGSIGSGAFVAVDNGSDTGKVSIPAILKPATDEIDAANARIDNIIAGGTAPSAAEVTDARLGAADLGSKQYSSLGEAIRGQVSTLYGDIIDTMYGIDLTVQRAQSDDNRAWGNVRVSPVTYIGQVITITNNGATYIIVSPKDSSGTDVGAYARIEPGATGTLVITVIPDYINIYCDVYPIDVYFTAPSINEFIEGKIDNLSTQFEDLAFNYLEGRICYKTLEDFDLTENKYYSNSLSPTTPTDGNTYHITAPFVVQPGTYSYYGIDSYWSHYVTLAGVRTRLGSGENSGTVTFTEPMTMYLSVRENLAGYSNANWVSGDQVLSVAPVKGYSSKKIDELDVITQIMASVNMFNSVAALGDSYTAASVRNSSGTWEDYPNNSWIATMCKRSGVDWFNYGVGGTTAKTYANSSKFNNQVLTESAKDIYFICLGINDHWQAMTLGSISDINDSDYTQNGDSFYGWYGRIIARLMIHAPLAKIVLIKPWTYDAAHSAYGDAVAEIASHYGIPCIDPYDDIMFTGGTFELYMNAGHPTLLGYDMMGVAMERLFSKAVENNMLYFKFATVG